MIKNLHYEIYGGKNFDLKYGLMHLFLKLWRDDENLMWFFLVGFIVTMQKEKQSKKWIFEKMKWNWRLGIFYNGSVRWDDHFAIGGGLWMFLEVEKIEL